MAKTEKELKQIAVERSYEVVERKMENGNTKDFKRLATAKEQAIVEKILFGGLLAINSGTNKQGVMDACEYIGMLFLPKLNTYDTIYNQLREV